MGRNSGSQIHWTMTHNNGNATLTWYCQQHSKWEIAEETDITFIGVLENHFLTDHGCTKQ